LSLTVTEAIQLQARSVESLLASLYDGDGDAKGKGEKDDGNKTAPEKPTEIECAAEGEFCECENEIFFGVETKKHKLNRTEEFASAMPKDGEYGLMCSLDTFGITEEEVEDA
jgi:hypothetical protein